MRKRLAVALIGLFAFGALGAGVPAGKKKNDADRMYKEGVELLKKGDVEAAAGLFRKAVEIKRTAPLLFNLGQATAKLGRLSEARSLLKEARAEAEKNGPQTIVQLSTDALVELEARFPRIVVELPSEAKEAELVIDGARADSGPQGSQVEPGSHELVVTAPGYERFSETVSVKEGEKRRVSVQLAAIKTAGAPPPRPRHERKPVSDPEPAGKSTPIGPLLLGGVGIVALAGATYLFLKVKSIDRERHDLWEQSGCPGPTCPNGEPSDARTLRDSSESKARLGNILLGTGAACVVGAGVWFYFSSKPNKEQARIGIAPTLGGAVLSGQL